MGSSYKNRQSANVLTPINDLILVAGTFTTDGSGNPVTLNPTSGYAFTITRSGTGVYKVTLSDKAVAFMFGQASAISAAVSFAKVTAQDLTVPSVDFTFYTESAGTFAAANQLSATIHFVIGLGAGKRQSF